jgi:hypothetical protein
MLHRKVLLEPRQKDAIVMFLTFFLLLTAGLCVIRPQCKWKVYVVVKGKDC